MDDKDWGIYGKGFEGYAHYNAAYKATQHIAGQSKGSTPPDYTGLPADYWGKRNKQQLKELGSLAWKVALLWVAVMTMDYWAKPIIEFVVGIFC